MFIAIFLYFELQIKTKNYSSKVHLALSEWIKCDPVNIYLMDELNHFVNPPNFDLEMLQKT